MAAQDQEAQSVAVILVGGGARSGKSRFALERARREGSRLIYIATAEARDEEMRERIARHRQDRGAEFATIEEPLDLAGAIRLAEADAIVVDCLTLWLANVLERDAEALFADLEAAAREARGPVVFVTNEVGCSIVPGECNGAAVSRSSGNPESAHGQHSVRSVLDGLRAAAAD